MIQNRYETIRLVRYEKASIHKAISDFGFKSRSSYYLFSSQIREQGFIGLFDLRPFDRKITIVQEKPLNRLTDYNKYFYAQKRPSAAIWKLPYSSWNNAFYGLWDNKHKLFIQIIRALAEGNGIRGISRIFEIDKNTVLKYLKLAAYQCRRVTNFFIREMHVEELQLDEMWSFVYKKEKNLEENDYISCLNGDQWCWIAIDVRTKVIVQYEIGKRTYQLASDLIKNFKKRTDGVYPSLITTDGYKGYKMALLKFYGKTTKKKGKVPPPQMDYVVVKKTRKNGRVVDIKIEVIFGTIQRINNKIKNSPVSNNVNVAFVERSHLSRRQFNRRLTRKTSGFSKKLQNHLWQFELETAIHNFVRPHRGLKYNTPMMAAGKTDHVWSVEELLSFSV